MILRRSTAEVIDVAAVTTRDDSTAMSGLIDWAENVAAPAELWHFRAPVAIAGGAVPRLAGPVLSENA